MFWLAFGNESCSNDCLLPSLQLGNVESDGESVVEIWVRTGVIKGGYVGVTMMEESKGTNAKETRLSVLLLME